MASAELTNGKPVSFPKHFYSLDALRGLAALSVVFWHWQHFFCDGTKLGPFTPELQPLYFLFEPLYLYGWKAVDLFFCLSGFIFFWLYSERVAKREISSREFAVLRLSRLYPLHFLTLCFTALAQQFMLRHYGTYFVYPWNDSWHFVLQLFLASKWGFERGDSFNGPAWSVSVEVLLYAVFFLACRLNLRSWWHAAIFSCADFALAQLGAADVGRGMFSFFIGGATFCLFVHLRRRGLSLRALRILAVLSVSMWIVIPLNLRYNFLYNIYHQFGWHRMFAIHGKDVCGFILLLVPQFSFELVLFPLTILTLALWEANRGTLGRRLAFLGRISYSSYMLHFPLQLVFIIVVLHLTGHNSFFYSPWAFLLFFSTLIVLSLCSHRYVEMPCQSFIRERFRKTKGCH